MTGGTKRKIVVSTLAEADFFASHGFDDILYAYPITASKLQRWCNDRMKIYFYVIANKVFDITKFE